jgi:hypothetical protein
MAKPAGRFLPDRRRSGGTGVFDITDAVDEVCAPPRSERALREERSDKMRLRVPRVNQVRSDDGSAVLIYEGLDTSHDLGGGNYLLRLDAHEQTVEVRARIRSATAYDAERMAIKEGLNYHSMSFTEGLEYEESFADQYGRRSQVILFEKLSSTDIDGRALSRQLCLLFLEMDASYRFNHPEYPASGEGYYPDKIEFCPHDVERRLYMTVSAGEGLDV